MIIRSKQEYELPSTGWITGAAAALLLFVLIPAGIFAESRTAADFGTYIETETNNAPYSEGNLTLAPGLRVGIRGLDTPVYGRFVFENRMTAQNSATGYGGTELRHIYVAGVRFDIPEGNSFNPEIEIRVKNYAGYSFAEKSNVENRLHLRFLFQASRGWSVLVDTMPTLLLASGPANRQEGAAGDTTYYDFYNESLLGTVWIINPRNSLTAAFYNEIRDYQSYGWSDDSLNGGGIYLMNELQFRLSWSHRFNNQIILQPFTRIGIVRNEYFMDPGSVKRIGNYRRDRYGVIIRGTSSALSPLFEAYYQYQEQNGGAPRHMMFWKVGLNYAG